MTKCTVRTHGELNGGLLERACRVYLQDKKVQKVIYEIQGDLQRAGRDQLHG